MTLSEAHARCQAAGVAIRDLPFWAPMAGITLVPLGAIYRKRRYSESAALLEHELVHVEQQLRDGGLFFWRYLTSKTWRFRYEAEAYRTDVANRSCTIERAAQLLSGKLYWNCCTYDEAIAVLGQA